MALHHHKGSVAGENMKNKLLLIILLILFIIIITLFSVFKPNSRFENKDVFDSIKNSLQNKPKFVCGDGVCDEGERCCLDCGCNDNQICNPSTRFCEDKLNYSKQDMARFLRVNVDKIEYFNDTVYDSLVAKEVIVSCSDKYPCFKKYYIGKNYKVLDVFMTK